MENMKNEKYFDSSDLCEVAVLALHFPIESIDKVDPKRVIFFFKSSKELSEILKKLKDKKLKIEPQEFYAQIRAIKTMIYDRKPKGEVKGEPERKPEGESNSE